MTRKILDPSEKNLNSTQSRKNRPNKKVEGPTKPGKTRYMEIIPNLSAYQLPTATLTGTIAGGLAFLLYQKLSRKIEKPKNFPVILLVGFLFSGILTTLLLPIQPQNWGTNILLLVFTAIILAVSWEDLKTQTASNILTLGGTGAIFLLITFNWGINPHFTPDPIKAVLGAITGAGSLLAISFLGKLVFGRKITEFEPPEILEILPQEGIIKIGPETLPIQNLFQEGSGKVNFFSPTGKKILTILDESGRTVPKILNGEVKTNRFTTPRDVLGLGDVKFMLAIGCLCGPIGVIFTITSACVLGSVLAIPLAATNRRIPLTPFLSTGAVIYLWQGPQILTLMGW